ncbi:hypothetical protein M885DRAFT_18193 [Pelagophyceae sp. CCMP2097]|nr:hypothetical protein M885DRAFT_18193 [Pelagophyceae sp. CCMP2097]
MAVLVRVKRKRDDLPSETLIIAAPAKRERVAAFVHALSGLSVDEDAPRQPPEEDQEIREWHCFRKIDTLEENHAALRDGTGEEAARLLREARRLRKRPSSSVDAPIVEADDFASPQPLRRRRKAAKPRQIWAELTPRGDGGGGAFDLKACDLASASQTFFVGRQGQGPEASPTKGGSSLRGAVERRLDRAIFEAFADASKVCSFCNFGLVPFPYNVIRRAASHPCARSKWPWRLSSSTRRLAFRSITPDPLTGLRQWPRPNPQAGRRNDSRGRMRCLVSGTLSHKDLVSQGPCLSDFCAQGPRHRDVSGTVPRVLATEFFSQGHGDVVTGTLSQGPCHGTLPQRACHGTASRSLSRVLVVGALSRVLVSRDLAIGTSSWELVTGALSWDLAGPRYGDLVTTETLS